MFRNKRTFDYVDAAIDRNAEWSGWRMTGMDHFDPGESFTLVHDALEHFTNNETTLEQEMMAFGSMFLIRVLGGWWHRENAYHAGREAEIMASEIIRFLAESGWKIESRKGCQIHEDMRDYVLDREAIQHEILANEYNEHRGWVSQAHAYNAYIQCMRWASKGYAKACKRWKDSRPYQLCDLFCGIQRKVEQYQKQGEHGDRMTIQWCNKSLEYRVYVEKYYELEENQW